MALHGVTDPSESSAPAASVAPHRPGVIAVRWIVANMLPLVAFATAALIYLISNGLSITNLRPDRLRGLPNVGLVMIALAVVHAAMTSYLRGAVLRRLLPRFSMLLWCVVTFLFGVILLAGTVLASMFSLATFEQLLGRTPPNFVPEGKLGFFLLGWVFLSEFAGLIVGGLVGLVIGAIEALVLRRAATGLIGWTLWTAAAWGGAASLFLLGLLPMIFSRDLPAWVAMATAFAMPVLVGLAFALFTLPAVLALKPRSGLTAPAE